MSQFNESINNEIVSKCLDQIEATPSFIKSSNLFHNIIMDRLGFRYKQGESSFYKSPRSKVIVEELDDSSSSLLISTNYESHRYTNIYEKSLYSECYTCIEKLVFKEEWFPRLLKWNSTLLDKKTKSMVALFRRAMSTYNCGELVDGFGDRKSIRYRTFDPNALMRDKSVIRFVSGNEILNKFLQNDCRVYIPITNKGDDTQANIVYNFGKDIADAYGKIFDGNRYCVEILTHISKLSFSIDIYGLMNEERINYNTSSTTFKNDIDGITFDGEMSLTGVSSGQFNLKYNVVKSKGVK